EGARRPDEGGARLPLGRLPGRLLVLQVRLRARPAWPPRAVQLDERAEGDVASLASTQGARRAGPGAHRAGVRLPARRRGAARAQRDALGRTLVRKRRRLSRGSAEVARGLGSHWCAQLLAI